MTTNCMTLATVYEKHPVAPSILKKICLWKGDITKLEVDVIVTSANKDLTEGEGVNRAVHRAAGAALEAEVRLRELRRITEIGEAVSTSNCNIPYIKHIVHAMGPVVERGRQPTHQQEEHLLKCYAASIQELYNLPHLRTIAFCCISTGSDNSAHAYPSEVAADLVCDYFCRFIMQNKDRYDRIVICFDEQDDLDDLDCYNAFFEQYNLDMLKEMASDNQEVAGEEMDEAPIDGIIR